MVDTQYDVQSARLLAACRAAAVANAAGVNTLVWESVASPRVMIGDKAGYVLGLHRGRLPCIEIFQASQEWDREAVTLGTIVTTWTMRVHVNGPSTAAAESLARAIAQVALATMRADAYLADGNEAVRPMIQTPLGFAVEFDLRLWHTYCRSTYETDASITPAPPTPPVLPPTDVFYPALVNISGGRVITYEGGGWVLADNTNPAHAGVALAVAVGAIVAGDSGAGRLYGVMDDPSWSWPAPAPLYLHANGVLSPSVPTAGFMREVAHAVTGTRIMIEPEPAISLL